MKVLFPSSGIQKQDDAIGGCLLLSHAFGFLTRNGEQDIIMDQLDLIVRWVSFALCSRDATSGLEALLLFLNDIFTFLHSEEQQLSDLESAVLLPFVLEKAGSAKVSKIRFVYRMYLYLH